MDKDVSIFVGWDPRESEAFAVCRHSLQKYAPGVPIYALILDELREVGLYQRPLSRKGAQLWDDISDAPCSTEFSISRFIAPLIAKTKWAMFMDSDMLAVGNLDRLWAQLDDSKALHCVQHPAYTPPDQIKMDGQIQTQYSRKNWSSVMIFNTEHPANKKLTLGKVNTLPGRDLHRFCWLEDEDIGELDQEWNYLVGVTSNEVIPTIIHYTSGMPFMPGYENCEYAEEWQKARREWLLGTHTRIKRNGVVNWDYKSKDTLAL